MENERNTLADTGSAAPIAENIYSKLALASMPRLLSIMNREEIRPAFGSFDRNYWQYKQMDFSGSLYQTAAHSLALAFSYPFENNHYYRNGTILRWCEGAINYLATIQNRDGSFNHNFPAIYSVAAVSFPIYSASEAHLMLRENKEHKINEEAFLHCLEKAGNWLMNRFDFNVCNQETASLMALYNIYLITNDERFLKGAQEKLQNILGYQSEEGWFFEYRGSDFGYSTLTVDYLAKYYEKSGDQTVLEPLRKLVQYMTYFIHPNRTMGGEFASRNNEFIIPSGFEMISDHIPEAGAIADSNMIGLENGSIMGPSDMDDVYFSMNHHSFFQAALAFKNLRKEQVGKSLTSLPLNQPFTRYFDDAKLLVANTDDYYLVSGGRKGGIYRLYSKEEEESKLLLSDCGYFGKLSNGKLISTQWQDLRYDCSFSDEENHFVSKGKFHILNFELPTTLKMVLSRIALPLIGMSPAIRKKLYAHLRKKIIYEAPTIPLEFKRDIHFGEDAVDIKDTFTLTEQYRFTSMRNVPKFTTMYGQSKNFFQQQELEYQNLDSDPNLSTKICKLLNSKKTVTVQKTMTFPDQELITRIE